MATYGIENAATHSHEKHHAPEGIAHAAAAAAEHAPANQHAVSSAAAERSAQDKSAVAGGILPAKPEFFNSNQGKEKPPTMKSSDPAFDSLPPNVVDYGKDGIRRQVQFDSQGAQKRSSEDLSNGSGKTETVRPDSSSEVMTYSKGRLETKQFDKDGKLRDDQLNLSQTADGKYNYTGEKKWGSDGALQIDNNRWQDKGGKWHEDNSMNLPEGIKIHNTMDGDRSESKVTNPDGSWYDVVKTMNVDQINPDTGKRYKTMTVDRTESAKQ